MLDQWRDVLVPQSLQNEIDERAREIHTDRYSMSINEVVAMYQDGDLEIHPEFQRIFRWSLEQQSRLVESVFLGIPVPPVFVAQRADGVWDVVDGVQRLSTLFRFMGVLKKDDGQIDPPSPLDKGEYLTHLEGVIWDSEIKLGDSTADKEKLPLTSAQQRIFKRARLDFQIVQKESDDQAKFDLFQRLNSGTRLSEQEARNCLAVMLDPDFYRWLNELAEDAAYSSTVDITEKKEQEAYGVETVLRYLACARASMGELRKMGDFGEFLTAQMRNFIEDRSFDREYERKRFEFVFSLINETLKGSAFKRYYPTDDRFAGAFSVSAFEAITSGIARNYEYWSGLPDAERSEKIRDRVKLVWQDDVFAARSGGGKSANRRIPYMVEVGEQVFGG
ncbi:DUF262 domain-containing protein [Streptomyces parvulus]|uniref:DUF262 domain-containing protein n=1 Tax=Streptomyces parvulus TaxID=146923 RepID=UPI003791197D